MKKIALIVTVIALVCVVAVAFTACNNATTQGQLQNVWKHYEKYTYSVEYGEETGTYVSEITYHKAYSEELGNKVTVGDAEITQREGYLVSNTLDVGDTHFETQCYFELSNGSVYLVPRATYRKETVGDVDNIVMHGTYSGSTLNYTLKVGDNASTTGSVALSSPYYDNNEFHQSLRGISTMSTSLSFGFSTAIVAEDEIGKASLTFAIGGTEEVTTGVQAKQEDGSFAPLTVNCYKATLSRSTTVAGTAQTLYYSVDPVKAYVEGDQTIVDPTTEGATWNLAHVLVKIVEPYKTADGKIGNVVYTLQSVSLGTATAE